MRKILLIDDEPFIGNLVSMRILNRYSEKLEFVRWSPKSLVDQTCQQALKTFDSIFVDYVYPEGVGFRNGDDVVDFLLVAGIPQEKICFFTSAEPQKHKEIRKIDKTSPTEFCELVCGRLEEESKV